jgi:hypothetical protein
MSSLVAKKPRIAISNAQRKALRTWFHDPATSFGATKTLANAISWWNSQFGYNISRSTASDILSDKYSSLDNSNIKGNVKKDRKPKWPTLEQALVDWALQFESVHGTVSGDLLRIKATELWQKLDEYQGQEPPNWSEGWLEGFKSRFNFRRRRKAGESGSVEITEEILARMQEIRDIKAGYLPKDVYNMDETGFCWKRLPNAGLSTSSIGKKLDKTRITANFCCNEDGTDKLPIWFIGNAAQPRCFTQNRISNPENLGIFWRSNSTSWMNYKIMLEWLRWFDKRASRPVLLLMDNFSAHEAAVDLLEESGQGQPLQWTRIEWFPANTTSIFQQLDQGIIQNWKCFVKKQLLLFLKEEFDSGRDYTKTHNVLRAIQWGISAWEQVKLTTICGCWAKGFDISTHSLTVNSFAESNDLVEDIQAAAKAIGIQDMDINNFINPTEERVVDSTDDIIDLIVAQFNSKEEAEVEAIEPIVPAVTTTEAIKALNILKQYQEQRIEPINQDFMAYLRKELRDLESQRVNAQKQTTLEQWF